MNKLRIAQSFSRAANTYDASAYVQHEIGDQLFKGVDHNNPCCIIDLGCGTGFFTKKLKEKFKKSIIFGIDLAKGMLHVARKQLLVDTCWICADAEYLPFMSNSVDIVFSNLTIQWCSNYTHLFSEIKRVLKPGGMVFIATLGESTLHELRSAWQEADNAIHVNPFLSEGALLAYAAQADFSQINSLKEMKEVSYPTPIQLMRELKEIGAQEIMAQRSLGLTGKRRFQLVINTYEKLRTSVGLPATYEVIYLTLTK